MYAPVFLQINDAPLEMLRVGKIAGRQNIEIAVAVKIGHFRARRAIHREEVALDKIVAAVVLQNVTPW